MLGGAGRGGVDTGIKGETSRYPLHPLRSCPGQFITQEGCTMHAFVRHYRPS
jgi:hypothetical protein